MTKKHVLAKAARDVSHRVAEMLILLRATQTGRPEIRTILYCDSEESFGPDGISLRGALEAGGP